MTTCATARSGLSVRPSDCTSGLTVVLLLSSPSPDPGAQDSDCVDLMYNFTSSSEKLVVKDCLYETTSGGISYSNCTCANTGTILSYGSGTNKCTIKVGTTLALPISRAVQPHLNEDELTRVITAPSTNRGDCRATNTARACTSPCLHPTSPRRLLGSPPLGPPR